MSIKHFKIGETYTERGGMFDGVKWNISERWTTNERTYVRLETRYHGRNYATTMYVQVSMGHEYGRGAFLGYIRAK